jgi:PAT family beta-lactamase induction signal transducer AmpG
VFVAFMSSLCNLRFTATQYALMSSLAAFGRTWLSTPAGSVAEHIGWEAFFICSTLLAIPGLALLWWLPKGMKDDAISGETKS